MRLETDSAQKSSASVEQSLVTADIACTSQPTELTNEEQWAAYYATPEGKQYYNWYHNNNISADPSSSVPEVYTATPAYLIPEMDASEVCTIRTISFPDFAFSKTSIKNKSNSNFEPQALY